MTDGIDGEEIRMSARLLRIGLRTSIDEIEKLDSLAAKLSMSRSEVIRSLIACANAGILAPEDIDERTVLLLDTSTWRQIGAALNRWGNNYNQGVRSLNVAAKFFARGLMSRSVERTLGERLYAAEKNLAEAHAGIEEIRESVAIMKRASHVAY